MLLAEDEVIRTYKFKVETRPNKDTSVWRHVSGALLSHRDALIFVFNQLGYTHKQDGKWVHKQTRQMHTEQEIVSAMLKLLKQSKPRR